MTDQFLPADFPRPHGYKGLMEIMASHVGLRLNAALAHHVTD